MPQKPQKIINARNTRKRKVRIRTRESKLGLSWFYSLINKKAKDYDKDAFLPRKDPFIGGMFFYKYLAKHRDTLPIWDAFPIVLPFNIVDNGNRIFGINLHYLDIQTRFDIVEQLKSYLVTENNRQYVKASYTFLNTVIGYEVIKPAIKSYLLPQFRSRLVKVHPDDWDKAVALPVAQWRFNKGAI